MNSSYNITTESENKESTEIDLMSINKILNIMNMEDHYVPIAIRKVLPAIEEATMLIIEKLKCGGRLIYVGAGSSGRIGVIDAVEVGPTFGMGEYVKGLIAGGSKCMTVASEDQEDKFNDGIQVIRDNSITDMDFVMGLTASGRTNYVFGALKESKRLKASTGIITVNSIAEKYLPDINIIINPMTGPEVLTGSTRLKATTAMKLILNMISTTVMIKLGKTYSNYMCSLMVTNQKLKKRAVKIISTCCKLRENDAEQLLKKCNNNTSAAIVCGITGINAQTALELLLKYNGSIRKVIDNHKHFN